jgi:predicted Zn-dependent protease
MGALARDRDGSRRTAQRSGRPAACAGGRALAPAARQLAAQALAGCSSIGTIGPLDASGEAPTSAMVSLPPASTDPEHNRILSTYGGVYDDANAARAVARAVGRLVAASEDPSLTYRITLRNSPAVNAFALPSGNLYVTRGLLALANDTSEVAAVVAHEMAHVTARHAIARERRAEAAQVVNKVVANVMQDPEAQRMALVSTQVSLARFSQVQELEADAIGVRTLSKAGFDPYAASRFLSAMARYAEFRSLRPSPANAQQKPDFLASHPTTPERIAFAVRSAREIGAPGLGEQERDQFLANLDGMIFGDDPSEGFVRGRTFMHKALGIQFGVPQGFQLENTPKAVLATDQNGTALRFDGVQVPEGMPLTAYLGSGWVNGLQADTVKEVPIGEFAGAVATATADGWTFRIGAVRKDKTTYRFILAAQDPNDATEQIFLDTLTSFRRLTPADSARLRPLRLRIVKVKAGDTIERLAEQMSGIERRLDLFRVLNGIDESEPLEVGRSVKLVTER